MAELNVLGSKPCRGAKSENFRLQSAFARESYYDDISTDGWCSENESATEVEILNN